MSGTAIGTKMAPSYANLFMDVLEKQMLSSYKHKPLVYLRCIDDMFMIWTDGEDSLNDLNVTTKIKTSSSNKPFLTIQCPFSMSPSPWRVEN